MSEGTSEIAAGIDHREFFWVLAAAGHLRAQAWVAEIGEVHLVELQIAAARVGESPHGQSIGLAKIAIEVAHVGIDRFRHRLAAIAKMQRRWRGDCHFRQNPRMSFRESKMLEHRMTGKCAELAAHSQHHGLRIDALELDLALAQVSLHPEERSEKIVVPERAPEFTVGDGPKSNVFLFADYRRDLAILDRPEFIGGDFVSFPSGTSFFQRLGAKGCRHGRHGREV